MYPFIINRANRIAAAILALILVLLLVACGGNNEPAELTAIPISTATTSAASEPTTEPTPAATTETTAVEPMVEPTTEPTVTPAPVSNPITFLIVPDESEVRFSLGEILAGNPKTVVGTTSELAGELLVDINDLSTAQLGVIQINAGTFATDNNFRNGSIREFILQTDTYPFITFAPTSLTGLPAAAAVGDSITFEIVGDLTIRDVTQSVTFTATVTVISATQLEGSASTIVNRADFGLEIPSVPNVADVDEEVLLEIDFVAAAP
ncbi:MAG: YceI family protein [Candidatus Promineifilaceae bacterium]